MPAPRSGVSDPDGAFRVTLLEAALAYAGRGWHVFPIEPGGKRPIGALVPNGHLGATTDAEQIRTWWAQVPSANIGIALAPSKLVVLDVDVSDGKPGMASLKSIAADLGPTTLMARTGRGGLHLYYQAPPGVEPRRIIGFKPGLDLLGDGYVVAPPSQLGEPGQSYGWRN